MTRVTVVQWGHGGWRSTGGVYTTTATTGCHRHENKGHKTAGGCHGPYWSECTCHTYSAKVT